MNKASPVKPLRKATKVTRATIQLKPATTGAETMISLQTEPEPQVADEETGEKGSATISNLPLKNM
jgi:hypothetical protein